MCEIPTEIPTGKSVKRCFQGGRQRKQAKATTTTFEQQEEKKNLISIFHHIRDVKSSLF
jgi:hypothetical protein